MSELEEGRDRSKLQAFVADIPLFMTKSSSLGKAGLRRSSFSDDLDDSDAEFVISLALDESRWNDNNQEH
jgi:hypothetical protein